MVLFVLCVCVCVEEEEEEEEERVAGPTKVVTLHKDSHEIYEVTRELNFMKKKNRTTMTHADGGRNCHLLTLVMSNFYVTKHIS